MAVRGTVFRVEVKKDENGKYPLNGNSQTVKKKHLTLADSFAIIVEAGVKEKTLTCKMEVQE